MRRSLQALLVAIAVGGLAAQETEPVDVSGLARRLRSAEANDDERRGAVDQLLQAGPRGAVALLEALVAEGDLAHKAFVAEAARARAAFERRARPVLQKRMGRDGDKRVGVLRFEILQRSRGAGLSKEVVVAEIDPRLAELRALLTLEVNAVVADAPALAIQIERVRVLVARLVALWQCRVRADTALQDAPGGLDLLRRHPAFPDPSQHMANLDADLARLAERATPMSDRDARTLQANDALQEGVDAEEREGILALNRIRVLLGLPALLIDVKLCAAARDHSSDMVKLHFFSHDSPVAGKETPWARAQKAGTSASAENIAAGQATGADAILCWWYSPGHHKNMLGDATRVGLGRHATHWTQLFGG